MTLEPLEPLKPIKKTPKKRKTRVKKNVAPNKPVPKSSSRSYAEWNKLREKGKCTNCGTRKAVAPFLWCRKCAKEF